MFFDWIIIEVMYQYIASDILHCWNFPDKLGFFEMPPDLVLKFEWFVITSLNG